MKEKTYERCFICDISGELEAPNTAYSTGHTFGIGRRTVRIDLDGKPICSICYGTAMKASNELENLDDNDWKADDLSWLFGGDTPEDIVHTHTPISTEGARAALEGIQAQWRWQDLGYTRKDPVEAPDLTVQSDPEAA